MTKIGRFISLTLVFTLLLAAAREVSAAGLLVPRDGSPPIEVRSHHVTAVVTDGVARTTLRQTFVNPQNRPLEAVYLFPLPENAALTGVAMEAGGNRFEGLLVSRWRARRLYNKVVYGGRDPALVEQVGANLFRLSVFPVLPDAETVVEISWVEHLPLSGGELRYVYPLATPDGEAAQAADLTLDLTMRSGAPFSGFMANDPEIAFDDVAPGEFRARLSRSGALLDRDLVIRAGISPAESTLTVRTFKRGDEDGVFLAVVTPPAVAANEVLPRDIVLLLDTSKSMDGEKIGQARSSALFLLGRLRPVDHVNVIGFGSSVTSFADAPVPATEENLGALRLFVENLEPRGSTAFATALRKALDVPAADGRVRSVVLLTDGRPTIGTRNPAELVRIAKEGAAKGFRIFPFGVGGDVDAGLLRGIARATRGRAELFAPESEVASRLIRFLERTASPVLTDLECSVQDLVSYEVMPSPMRDVHLGEQIAIVGRYRFGGPSRVTVTGWMGGKPVHLLARFDFAEGSGGDRAVGDLYARERLADLEEQLRLRLALTDDAYYEALDRGAFASGGEIVREMIDVSLEFGVQCPFTSFLVLLPEDQASVDPRDEEAIAEALARLAKEKAEMADGNDPGPPDDGSAGTAPPAEPETGETVKTSTGLETGGETGLFPSGAGESPEMFPAPETPPDQAESDGRYTPPAKSNPGGSGGDPGSGGDDGGGDGGGEGEGEGGGGGGSGGGGNGGSYRGPCGDVPPGDRDPNDPPPPAEESPDYGSPDAGSGDSGGDVGGDRQPAPGESETSPGLSSTPGAAPTAGRATGKRSAPRPITFDSWLFWWGYNRDSILETRSKTLRTEPLMPAPPEVSRGLVPPLLVAVANPAQPRRVREAALIAVARIGGDRVRRTLLRLSRPADREGLTDAAITGLALLPTGADLEIRDRLIGILDDASLRDGTRSRAAMALGLRREASNESFAALARRVDGREASRDLVACTFLAMGLMGDTSRVPQMAEWLELGRVGSAKLSDFETAWLVVALGRLEDPRALPAIGTAARRRGIHLGRAVPVALGSILARADGDTVRNWFPRLARYGESSDDLTTRLLTLAALGRVGAATSDAGSYRRIEDLLLSRFREGKREEREWAALAVGLLGMEKPDGTERPEALRYRLAEPIRKVFAKGKEDEIVIGACAVALGMLRDGSTATVDRLVALFTSLEEDRKLRGAAATALGLIGGDRARGVLADAIREKDDRGLRTDSASALGILGGRGAGSALATIFADQRADAWALAATAAALGPNGETAEVALLLDVLDPFWSEAGRPTGHRAMAAAALGAIGSRGAPRELTRLSRDFPWRSTVPTLDSLLSLP